MMRFLPCVAGALLTATAVEARVEKDSSRSLQAVLDPSGSLLDGPPSSSSSAAASAAQAAGDRGKKTMRRHIKNHAQQEQQEPRSPPAAALVRKSSTSSSTRSGQKNSPKPKTGTSSSALQTLVRRMDAKKKSKAGALVRSSATQKKSSSRLRTGKASMKSSVEDQCDLVASAGAGTTGDATACKNACIAEELQCFGLGPTDSHSSQSTPTTGTPCSESCLTAKDDHETQCPARFTLVSAQQSRENCENQPQPANATVGDYCGLMGVSDGTSCQDACTAYFASCYEADEAALVDDVEQDETLKDSYCTEGCYSAIDSFTDACPGGTEGGHLSGADAKDACEFGANFAAALFYFWLYCIMAFMCFICCCLGLAFIFCYSSVACLFVCCQAVNKPAAPAAEGAAAPAAVGEPVEAAGEQGADAAPAAEEAA